MTIDAHTASAIATIVFYAPMVPVTFYVGIKAWKFGPRLAWYPPMPFALVRLTGGALVIAKQYDPTNVGLIITTIVLLNIGLIPLILSWHSITRLLLVTNFREKRTTRLFLKATRFSILGAICLMAASGGLTGKSAQAQTQGILSKVAYFEFLGLLLALSAMSAYLYFIRHREVKENQLVYLKWMLIASPALFVRAAYGLIGVFLATGTNIFTSIWSPLYGSATAFSLMALLPEYIVLCIYIHLAVYRVRTSTLESVREELPRSEGSFLDRLLGRKGKKEKSNSDHSFETK